LIVARWSGRTRHGNVRVRISRFLLLTGSDVRNTREPFKVRVPFTTRSNGKMIFAFGGVESTNACNPAVESGDDGPGLPVTGVMRVNGSVSVCRSGTMYPPIAADPSVTAPNPNDSINGGMTDDARPPPEMPGMSCKVAWTRPSGRISNAFAGATYRT
jgi:hypothetical protein